jgi:hypothetical protein
MVKMLKSSGSCFGRRCLWEKVACSREKLVLWKMVALGNVSVEGNELSKLEKLGIKAWGTLYILQQVEASAGALNRSS